jgi:hypothetical protein
MEDHDYRVIEARAALVEARKRAPGELSLDDLREEITRFRKYVRWLIAPADTFKLCDDCTKMLDLIWEGQQCPASDSAA